MTSRCENCTFAKGVRDGLVYSPGDDAGDAVFCTNLDFLKKYDYEAYEDPKYGLGVLLYRVEVIVGENEVCNEGMPAGFPELFEGSAE